MWGKEGTFLCVRTCVKDTRLFGNCRNSKERGRRFDPKELLHLADQLKKGDEISVDGYEVKEGKLHRRSGTPPVPWCLPWKMQDS